jgi:hypothetical protein
LLDVCGAGKPPGNRRETTSTSASGKFSSISSFTRPPQS